MSKHVDPVSLSDSVIHEYYAMLYRYCYFKVYDTHVAQDTVQEVFIRFFQRRDQYHTSEKMK